MGKLIALAALLAALLAVSAVSARTTITTTVVEDDSAETNPSRQEGSCQEQVRRQDNFNMCQRFLMERTKQRGSFYDEVAMVTGGENPQERGEHLKECCRQMENVREECRCEGLSMMMKHQQQREQQQRQQMQEMKREAENLPSMCDLGPRQCQIQTAAF